MNDVISLNINNVIEDYRLLYIIDKEYKYVIYTDINNENITKKLYAIKVKSFVNNEKTLPISDDEWKMIENKYHELIKK